MSSSCDDKEARKNLKQERKIGRERQRKNKGGKSVWRSWGDCLLKQVVEKGLPNKITFEERTEEDEK